MKYKNKDISDLELEELKAADFELATQEARFNEALKHPKFEKLKPLPTMSPSFLQLRNEIKNQLELKNVAN